MIAIEKERNALLAMNAILVHARALAHDGRSEDVATVLDVAEYLPLLMLDAADRTDEFREQLVDLAARFPRFGHALQRFDTGAP